MNKILFNKLIVSAALSLGAIFPLSVTNAEATKIKLDELPVLGFITLGTTTFGQVASELAPKKCTMEFWPKSMLTNKGCLDLPGKASINFEAQKTLKEVIEGRAHRVRRLDKKIASLPVIEIWLNIEAPESNACAEYREIFEQLEPSSTSEEENPKVREVKAAWQLGEVRIQMKTVPGEGCTISYSLANGKSATK